MYRVGVCRVLYSLQNPPISWQMQIHINEIVMTNIVCFYSRLAMVRSWKCKKEQRAVICVIVYSVVSIARSRIYFEPFTPILSIVVVVSHTDWESKNTKNPFNRLISLTRYYYSIFLLSRQQVVVLLCIQLSNSSNNLSITRISTDVFYSCIFVQIYQKFPPIHYSSSLKYLVC